MAFEIGTVVEVNITGRPGRTMTVTPPSGTDKVVQTKKGGWSHYANFSSDNVTRDGDLITARFPAVVTGAYKASPIATTEVREITADGTSGCLHYLYLDSRAIKPKEGAMAYAVGDTVHVKLTGTVGVRVRQKPGIPIGSLITSANEVREPLGGVSGSYLTHYLYLGSDLIAGGTTAGATVTAEFDAVITGPLGKSEIGTTEVQEIDADGNLRFTHYLYLNSRTVTKLGRKKKEVPAVAYKINDKIRVDITARVTGLSSNTRSATSKVVEIRGGNSVHYLYLTPSTDSVTGDKVIGGTVRAQFDAEIYEDVASGPDFTTKVREIRGDSGSYRPVHYVFLNSLAVTKLGLGSEPAGEVTVPASIGTARLERSTKAITSSDTVIESDEVSARISELETQRYTVVKLRNNEVLDNFDNEAAAKSYIDKEDYNPERVVVLSAELTDDDATELRLLCMLRDSVNVSSSWTLYNRSYFTDDWAKSTAREMLGSINTDSWPLNLVNWREAARQERDRRYPRQYSFDNVIFHGAEEA